MLLKNHPHLYHNFTVNMMEFCDLIKLSEVKRETGVAVKATLQDAPHCNCMDSWEAREVPRVKVETDIAETAACCDPREVPRAMVKSDIAETDSRYISREVPRVKVESDFAKADSCCDMRAVSRVKVDTDIAETGARCECDPREVPSMKVETDVAKTDSCCDPREVNEVPRVKVETDIAETDSCCDPREVPRVKVKTDIAAASTRSDSGSDTIDCYKPDPSHTSEVKIEIDVAEETPLSLTVEDPVMQSKLPAALHLHFFFFILILKILSHVSIRQLKLNVFYCLNQREFFLLS